MDKETLSNYGWMVVCVMVLAIMIALATPFGTFIKSSVENTTQGLFDTKQSAFEAAGIDIADQSFEGGSDTSTPTPEELIASGIVPEYGTYYVGVTSNQTGDYTGATTTYTAGQTMPLTTSTGDVFVHGDYEYRYGCNYCIACYIWSNDCDCFSQINGWGVRVLDDTKTEYGAILESINGQPVTNMNSAFIWCNNLIDASSIIIPNGVTDMENTFYECKSLTTAPVIPNSVTNMRQTFYYCTKLTTAPVIPSSLTNMDNTFSGCTSLKTYIGNTDADGDFSNYVIPSSVTNMNGTFYECTLLTGEIEINAIIDTSTTWNYNGCFKNTVLPITLTGTSPNLELLTDTANNGNVTVAG